MSPGRCPALSYAGLSALRRLMLGQTYGVAIGWYEAAPLALGGGDEAKVSWRRSPEAPPRITGEAEPQTASITNEHERTRMNTNEHE